MPTPQRPSGNFQHPLRIHGAAHHGQEDLVCSGCNRVLDFLRGCVNRPVDPADNAGSRAGAHATKICTSLTVDLGVFAGLPALLTEIFPIDDDFVDAGIHGGGDKLRISGKKGKAESVALGSDIFSYAME